MLAVISNWHVMQQAECLLQDMSDANVSQHACEGKSRQTEPAALLQRLEGLTSQLVQHLQAAHGFNVVH